MEQSHVAPVGDLVACDPLPTWMAWLDRHTPRWTPKPPRHRTHAVGEGASRSRCGITLRRLDTAGYESTFFDDVSASIRCQVCDLIVRSEHTVIREPRPDRVVQRAL